MNENWPTPRRRVESPTFRFIVDWENRTLYPLGTEHEGFNLELDIPKDRSDTETWVGRLIAYPDDLEEA